MAKKKAASGSVSGYFRKIFEQQPRLLHKRSNAVLFKRWLADHPGQKEVPLNVKQGLSNLKSALRKKGKKRGPKAGGAATNGEAPRAVRVPAAVLEKLEFQIDDCLMLARGANPEALRDVIDELRKARNAVVWKEGE